MPSYKDVSSEDSDDFQDVESSFNLTTEEDNTIEGGKREIKSRGVVKKAEEVTDLLQNCKLDGSTIVYVDSDEYEDLVDDEDVVEGHIVGGAEVGKVLEGNESDEDSMAGDDVVDFDQENGQDGDKAQSEGRSIKVEFEPNDIKFWFSQLEDEMLMASVKSQWLKKTILQRNLPNKQKEDVKAYLTLSKTEAGGDIYFRIKQEIVRIYAPKPQDAYQ